MEKDYFVPFADFGEDKFEEKTLQIHRTAVARGNGGAGGGEDQEMRETFWDATHNCYAYILREGNVMRYSDDGEPQGTAGMPILEVLRHENPDRLRVRRHALFRRHPARHGRPCPRVHAGRAGRCRGGGRAAHEPVYRRAHRVPVTICTTS